MTWAAVGVVAAGAGVVLLLGLGVVLALGTLVDVLRWWEDD